MPTASQIRRDIMDHMPMPVAVWSLNGRDVGFQAGFDSGLEVGGFVGVRTPAGVELLMQVLELRVSEREAMRVEVETEMFGDAASAALQSANVGLVMRFVEGEGRVLASVVDGALAIASIMSATGSFDHRAIDGADGAQMMQAFKDLVEQPLGLVA